jgi:glycosyltransferase involved in cell wall biosynthesis
VTPAPRRQTVVMLTSSYPRFPGDSVGTFMEPIAMGIAARGHDVHVVAPWHPLLTRGAEDRGVHFHFYRYAPAPSLNVFGYAASLRADVTLRAAAMAATPLALVQGWRTARRVARRYRATLVHGHWVVPGGITAALAAPALPLVVSLHGSDVYVAETLAPARLAARAAFRRAGCVTACSEDLARRAAALGAPPSRLQVIPYGVDVERFRPDADVRAACRARLRLPDEVALVFTAGRLVRKKGFEYLIDAFGQLRHGGPVVLAIGGEGDLDGELRALAARSPRQDTIRFLGRLTQDEVARHLAAADVVVIPSVRDAAGNVDGLPNVVLEALASGTPLVTTAAGGIGTVAAHERTALVVPERDAPAIARAIDRLLQTPEMGQALGSAGRKLVAERFGWTRTAEAFEAAYERAIAFKSSGR